MSFLSAYRYNHLRHKLKLDQQPSKTQQRIIRKKIEDRIYHSIPCNKANIIFQNPNIIIVTNNFVTLVITLTISGLSRRFGTLPYLPFAWFVYSAFLVFKVGIIFSTYVNFFRTTNDNFNVKAFQRNITNCSMITNEPLKYGEAVYEQESVLELGPNLLKLAVGSTALVFIIILQVILVLICYKSL